MAINLNHATVDQLVARLRHRYKRASKEETWRLAAMLKNHYDAGDFTASQLRNAFDMTPQQFSTFVAKVTDYAAKWEELKSSAGE